MNTTETILTIALCVLCTGAFLFWIRAMLDHDIKRWKEKRRARKLFDRWNRN